MQWLYHLYYLVSCPKDKKKKVSFFGIEAGFGIYNQLQLRLVETAFTEGMGDERVALKELLDEIVAGDVVYDIGASIGIHTIFMAKKSGPSGRVVAIEPEVNSFVSLIENISLNGLNNVIPIQLALGDTPSEKALYSQGATGVFSLIERRRDKASQKVKIVTADALVKDRNLPLPNVIKIDVEGYEYYVLKGLEGALKQARCRYVFCEVHPAALPKGIEPDAVKELLRGYGFNQCQIHSRGETLHLFCRK
jgi:FkbM family methyltransferase